jgi:hypothetical protein
MKKNKSKCADPKVKMEMRRLWDQGYSRQRIAETMQISKTAVETRTKNWRVRCFREPSRRRTFDYHIAYCLVYEHGLTFAETAQAMELKNVNSLRVILLKNKAKIEEMHPAWKTWYADKQRILRPRRLYSVAIKRKLIIDKWTPEQKEESRIKMIASNPVMMKGYKQAVVTCPHCNKSGGKGQMKTYHFDNCKQRSFLMAAE